MIIDNSLPFKAEDRGAGGLLDYAKLILRQLGYDAVAIQITEPLGTLVPYSNEDTPQIVEMSVAVATAFHLGDCIQPLAKDLVDPIAAGEHGFGFYAGLPLRLASGTKVGTLAVLLHQPRVLAENELKNLRAFGDIIVQLLQRG